MEESDSDVLGGEVGLVACYSSSSCYMLEAFGVQFSSIFKAFSKQAFFFSYIIACMVR